MEGIHTTLNPMVNPMVVEMIFLSSRLFLYFAFLLVFLRVWFGHPQEKGFLGTRTKLRCLCLSLMIKHTLSLSKYSSNKIAKMYNFYLFIFEKRCNIYLLFVINKYRTTLFYIGPRDSG